MEDQCSLVAAKSSQEFYRWDGGRVIVDWAVGSLGLCKSRFGALAWHKQSWARWWILGQMFSVAKISLIEGVEFSRGANSWVCRKSRLELEVLPNERVTLKAQS